VNTGGISTGARSGFPYTASTSSQFNNGETIPSSAMNRMLDDVFMMETHMIDSPIGIGVKKMAAETVLVQSVSASATYTISFNSSTPDTSSLCTFIPSGTFTKNGSAKLLVQARPCMDKSVAGTDFTGYVIINNQTMRNTLTVEDSTNRRRSYDTNSFNLFSACMSATPLRVGITDDNKRLYLTRVLDGLAVQYPQWADNKVDLDWAPLGNGPIGISMGSGLGVAGYPATGSFVYVDTATGHDLECMVRLHNRSVTPGYPFYLEMPTISLSSTVSVRMHLRIMGAYEATPLTIAMFETHAVGDTSGAAGYLQSSTAATWCDVGFGQVRVVDFPVTPQAKTCSAIGIHTPSGNSLETWNVGIERIEFLENTETSSFVADRPHPLYTFKWWWSADNQISFRIIPGMNQQLNMIANSKGDMGDFIISLMAVG